MTQVPLHGVPAPPRRLGHVARLTDQLAAVGRMSRVRLTLMVTVATWFGYAMGAAEAGYALGSSLSLFALLVGVTLASMGSSVLNQVLERDADALMERTRARPLPAGEFSVAAAIACGVAMSLVGVVLIWVLLNGLAALLTLFTVLSYVFFYTPMKRRTTLSTVVGAVPGALPPVIGVVAATGAINATAWVMFAILFLWQLPHFLAIAWRYREQYKKAGLAVLPVVDPTGGCTFRQVLLSTTALIAVSLMPTMLGICGPMYFFGALAAGLVLLSFGVALAIGHRDSQARALFVATLAYLPTVYGLMWIDRLY